MLDNYASFLCCTWHIETAGIFLVMIRNCWKTERNIILEISGISFKGGVTVSVMEDNGEGTRKGIVMNIDGDWTAPKDYTDIDVIGTFVKGTYAMEFHVLPENITIKE